MAIHVPEGIGGHSSEPNVVPMIDIMLVLLIIFMMQVPLSRKVMDVQVPAPPPDNPEQSPQRSDQIVLELTADGGYAINTELVPQAQLVQRLHEIYDNRPAKLMFVKSAPNRLYQEVIDAMDIARGAGVQVIGFTPTDQSQSTQ
jgi:biopolymer transport protein TolR